MTLRPTRRWVVWLAAIQLFILTASNGRPFWTSSGAWVTLTAILLISARGFDLLIYSAFSEKMRSLSCAMILFIIANLISAAANPSVDAFTEVFLRSFIPFIVYFSLVGLFLRPSDNKILAYSLLFGVGVLLTRGFFAYVSSVSVLDLHTILWARYDVEMMSNYSDATLGNVGRLGGYIVLVFPLAFWIALSSSQRVFMRFAMAIICFLAFTHLLFCGSRTGLALTIIEIAAVIMLRGPRRFILITFAIFGITLAIIGSWVASLLTPELIDRFLPALDSQKQDASAMDRIASITEGWDIFINNILFGIGPGSSKIQSIFTVPHQSIIHQLAELGIFGGTVFASMCFIIIMMAWRAFREAARDSSAAHTWAWSSGPAFWIIFGLLAGISFTSSLALAWVGIAYAMLAVASAKIIDEI